MFNGPILAKSYSVDSIFKISPRLCMNMKANSFLQLSLKSTFADVFTVFLKSVYSVACDHVFVVVFGSLVVAT